ncbi:MAG: M23 family metallopeptidase [Bacteroidales bacterium]|jgi:murein DD-endopeptidase MepM/ murein hydrolase activator NlpD|nr:M23 family metallopeptidase [Bacteroidales bacterium]
MAKHKFRFNHHNLTYEKIETGIRQTINNILIYVSIALAFGGIGALLALYLVDSPTERILKKEIAQYELELKIFNDKLAEIENVLADIEYRDDNIYRIIFEAEPISSDIRKAGYGGTDRYFKYDNYENGELLKDISKKIDILSGRLYTQTTSLDEIYGLAINKEQMLNSIPAIRPVRETDVRRIASHYGYRTDPFYKVRKMHHGIDFSMAVGEDVIVTGDGVVSELQKNKQNGYGYYVEIDHGFGYKTIYAHLSAFNVKKGDNVKRGQVIGYVGNTGKSTSPHLHYEIRKNDKSVNPINYFFNDINPEEYETMLQLSEIPSQSMD